MPLTCNHDGCECAVTLRNDNGAQHPQTRVEYYECEVGHTFSVVLTADGVERA